MDKKYKNIIEKLKEQQHSAPDNWVFIKSELDLKDSISQLSDYSPNADLWDELSNKIDKPNNKFVIVVFSLGLLAAVIYGLWNIEEQQQVRYDSEIIYAESYEEKQDLLDMDELGINYIENYSFLFQDPSLKEFNNQLNELENAMETLEKIKTQYGTDDKTVKLYAKLKRKKAELIKSMIKRA